MATLESLIELAARLEVEGDALVRDRVHPKFGTHAQATLRWSTTDPPMAQVPGNMEVLFAPAPGYGYFRYDWSALHLWLTAAYAGDKRLMDMMRTGSDLHTINCCDLFGLPHPPDKIDPHKATSCAEWRAVTAWEGKDDIRRTFAKRFLYRVLKGGDVNQPPAGIPMTMFGGSSTGFVTASKRWALANAQVMQWQQRVKQQVVDKGMVRTSWGKIRRFSRRDETAQRGGIDFMCQGTEAEILNDTIIQTLSQLDNIDIRFSYQRHDCIIWEVAHRHWSDDVLQRIADIALREITIEGMTFHLDASFHMRQHAEDKKVAWVPQQQRKG